MPPYPKEKNNTFNTLPLSIQTLLNQKNSIKLNINKNIEINYLTKLEILKISIINNSPIYLIDEKLKNIILKIIFLKYPKHTHEYIEKLLTLDKESFINYFMRLRFNKKTKRNIESRSIAKSYLLKPFKNSLNTELLRLNEEEKSYLLKQFRNNNYNNLISDKYLSKPFKKNLNTESMLNEEEKSIKELLNKFIKNKYYKDYLDFYLTHFIDTKLDIDSIINKMKFNNYLNTDNEIIESFKENLKLLLRSLSYAELNIFNEFISGSIIEQNIYTFNLYNTIHDPNMLYEVPMKSHTCFISLDINITMFSELYFNDENKKNNFVDTIKNLLINGFSSY